MKKEMREQIFKEIVEKIQIDKRNQESQTKNRETPTPHYFSENNIKKYLEKEAEVSEKLQKAESRLKLLKEKERSFDATRTAKSMPKKINNFIETR